MRFAHIIASHCRTATATAKAEIPAREYDIPTAVQILLSQARACAIANYLLE